jgi:hypothetical protein
MEFNIITIFKFILYPRNIYKEADICVYLLHVYLHFA